MPEIAAAPGQVFITPPPEWLPEFAKPTWQWFKRDLKLARYESMYMTPAPILNNASNVIAAGHLVSEMFMFKSGMSTGKLVDNPSSWNEWVKDPLKITWKEWIKQPALKIWNDLYTRGSSSDYSFRDLFRGNPIKNIHHYIFDTNDATLRQARRLREKKEPIKFGNPWQARTTAAGMIPWTLGMLIPEEKQSEEEIERMAKLSVESPLGYVGERLKQAVWIPEWNQHKPQMIGLGYLGVGTLSTLGAWRNRGDLNPKNAKDAKLLEKAGLEGFHLKQGYRFNAGYLFTAIVSYLGGLALLFSLDERSSYANYGAISPLRIPALFSSIGQKYRGNEVGWESYATGKIGFQVADFLFSMIGGAEKRLRADGSYEIVDHDALKQEAINEAKEEKLEKKLLEVREQPATKVTQVNRAQEVETTEKAMGVA